MEILKVLVLAGLILAAVVGTAGAKVCPNCDADNHDAARYCRECGYDFRVQETVADLLEQARDVYEAGKWDEALGLYRKVLDAEPQNALAQERVSQCSAKLEEERRARERAEEMARHEAEYEAWISEARQNRQDWLATAGAILDEGDATEASRNVLRALSADWEWEQGRELLTEVLRRGLWTMQYCDVEGAFADLSIAQGHREQLKQTANEVCATLLSARESLEALPATGVLKVTSDPSGARVIIDGSYAGITPIDSVAVLVGTREVRMEKPLHERWEGLVRVADSRAVLLSPVLLRKTKGKALVRSAALPGWGQRYRERPAAGWSYTVVQLAAVGVAAYARVAYEDALDEYDDSKDDYERAITNIDERWAEVQRKYDEAKDKRRTGNVAVSLAAVVYLANLLDSVLF